VSKKEYDKEEKIKTIESDLESEKKSDPSPSSVMSDPTVTHKPRVPYPQALDASFPSKKDKKRDAKRETFKQVKVNVPLLEAIR